MYGPVVLLHIIIFCRWASCHCLAVNITAHKSIKSLVHLAGLPRPLKELRVLTIGRGHGDPWWSSIVEGASSYSKLGAGGYVQHYHGRYYHVDLINPAGHNHIGHSIQMCF